MNTQLPLIFSSQEYDWLADSIAEKTGYSRGRIEFRIFPDQERYRLIETEVDERPVVFIAGTIHDAAAMELFDLGCAMSKLGAKSLTLVVPYFGYSTMERAVKRGEVVTAKARARLLSAIPPSAEGNRVVMIDLHSEGIPHYFEGAMVAHHLYAKPLVMDMCRAVGGEDFVLAATDSGRAKWVESLANDMGVEAAFVFKRRLDGWRTEVKAMSADVKGKKVVIYDDMIRTGNSLRNAAHAYLKSGATEVHAVATHGVFPANAVEELLNDGAIKSISVTDTHPRARQFESEALHLYSVDGLLSQFLLQHFPPTLP